MRRSRAVRKAVGFVNYSFAFLNMFLKLKPLCILNEELWCTSPPPPHLSPIPLHVSNNSVALIISPSVLPWKCLNVISYTLCPTGLYPERAHCPTHLVFLPWDTCRHPSPPVKSPASKHTALRFLFFSRNKAATFIRVSLEISLIFLCAVFSQPISI